MVLHSCKHIYTFPHRLCILAIDAMIRLLFVLGLLGHCVRAISNQTTSYAQGRFSGYELIRHLLYANPLYS